MNEKDFLENMQEILRMDTEASMDTRLDELDEWDSMAMLATVAFAEEEFHVTLDVNDFKSFETLKDIYVGLSSHEH